MRLVIEVAGAQVPVMRRTHVIIGIFAVALVLSACGGLSTKGPTLEAAAAAPAFTLADEQGRPVALDDLRARGPVVLVFYRGWW